MSVGVGLFDRPDRAIGALRDLSDEVQSDAEPHIDELAELIAADAGTRFWTESDMRIYAALLNRLTERLGVVLVDSDGEPVHLDVRGWNRSPRRYALFRCRRGRGAVSCHREFPGELTLVMGGV